MIYPVDSVIHLSNNPGLAEQLTGLNFLGIYHRSTKLLKLAYQVGDEFFTRLGMGFSRHWSAATRFLVLDLTPKKNNTSMSKAYNETSSPEQSIASILRTTVTK